MASITVCRKSSSARLASSQPTETVRPLSKCQRNDAGDAVQNLLPAAGIFCGDLAVGDGYGQVGVTHAGPQRSRDIGLRHTTPGGDPGVPGGFDRGGDGGDFFLAHGRCAASISSTPASSSAAAMAAFSAVVKATPELLAVAQGGVVDGETLCGLCHCRRS